MGGELITRRKYFCGQRGAYQLGRAGEGPAYCPHASANLGDDTTSLSKKILVSKEKAGRTAPGLRTCADVRVECSAIGFDRCASPRPAMRHPAQPRHALPHLSCHATSHSYALKCRVLQRSLCRVRQRRRTRVRAATRQSPQIRMNCKRYSLRGGRHCSERNSLEISPLSL